MRTVLGTVIGFLLVFIILAWIGMESSPAQRAPEAMEFALHWSTRFFGALTAVVAAVGLVFVAGSKGSLERQIDLILPLLSGLLLMHANWGLAIAVGAIAVTWLLRAAIGAGTSGTRP